MISPGKILVVATMVISFAVAEEAYVAKRGNSVSIGNASLERTLSFEDGDIKTVEFINKLSGKHYSVRSKELRLSVVFAGFGPAVGKHQNGENPSVLALTDFEYKGMQQQDVPGGGKRLSFQFRLQRFEADLSLTIHYQIEAGDFYLRKWIELSDSADAIHFLDYIDLEVLTCESSSFSHGEFGQPILGNDFFIGVEYPGVENKLRGKDVSCGYVVGKKIAKTVLESEKAVFGVAPSAGSLEHHFLSYINRIKAGKTRPFLLYNSWYDMRHPSRVNAAENVMNEPNALNRAASLRRQLSAHGGAVLDAFVLDDGWDNFYSIWDIDTTTFPQRFTPLSHSLAGSGTVLGMWASPFSGYDVRDKRVNWAGEHGYERTGEFLCFAGEKYKSEFKRKMVEYVKQFGIGYFKWDGFLLACNETNHGHLPGIYSREALIATYREMMEAVRKVNPDIFLNVTVGTWLSPWWLMYADCIWMQGEDYAYSEDVPSVATRDKAITYRDGVLWGDFQKYHLLFPMSSMMTHGIIKGRLNQLGGERESLSSFTNEVMMYFGRGVMMWELYISPDILTSPEWDAIGLALRWAKENANVLSTTKMILGNPLKREPYGYVHAGSQKAIVLLRNPFVEPASVTLRLDDAFSALSRSEEYAVTLTYPYNMILPGTVKFGEQVQIPMEGYEVAVVELIPKQQLASELPTGVRYSTEGTRIRIFEEKGKTTQWQTVDGKKQETTFDLKQESITAKETDFRRLAATKVLSTIELALPDSFAELNLGILFEPEKKLDGDDLPRFKFSVDGKEAQAVIDQEGGRWFWATLPLESGSHKVEYVIESRQSVAGSVNSWLFAEQCLGEKEVERALSVEGAMPLPRPYPPNSMAASKKISSHSMTK